MNERGFLTLPDPVEAARNAALNVPENATDTQLRVRAKTMSEGFALATAIANLGDQYLKDANTPEGQKDARARAHADAINMLATGRHDYEGKAWTDDHKGFKTGQEYFSHMRGLVLGANPLTEDYRAYLAADEEERDRLAAEDEKLFDKAVRAGGDVVSALQNHFGTAALSDEEMRAAPEDIRSAGNILAERDARRKRARATADPLGMAATSSAQPYEAPEGLDEAEKSVSEWRDVRRRAGIRAKYEAKLMRKNAGVLLATMLPMLKSENAQLCAKAILDSPDNALPEHLYDRFRNLDDDEKAILGRVRSMMKPATPGGFWNTIGDMGAGAANVGASIIAAPYRFSNKLATNYFLGDYGFDVNKIARDRQALYEVTG
ncbi:MAG: hypothetical protein J6W80_02250, partial [Kiritimatiellae bacterium]|nr:hypothetical protein [Kiritimatiellia bacterium]